jgi:iron complex outermembrane recepter protein
MQPKKPKISKGDTSVSMSNFRGSSRLSFRAALGMTVAMSAFAVPGFAQEAAEETVEDVKTLETITITATKREQTLQDVPVAVSVVDDTVIEQAAIVDLNDLQSVIPSLKVGQLQSSANTNFVIRGFGNGANNVGIEPSVGVFIDGVYRSRSAAQISDLPNIQRVEVLRGPQSTLFGKNASAGVISVVTKKPGDEFGGDVEATLTNFNGYRLGGYVNGPITDTIGFSLGGNYNVRDAYVEDVGPGPDQNERNRYGIRGELTFDPNDNTSLRLIGDFDKIDEICCAAANVVNGPTGAIVRGIAAGSGIPIGLVAEDPFAYQVSYNFGSQNDIENAGISLQGDFDFGGAVLTSISAFRKTETLTNQDSDFTAANIIRANIGTSEIETLTQELRLTSTGDGAIDWLIGGFYFDESVASTTDFQYGDGFRPYIDALTGGGGGLRLIENGIGGPAAVGRLFGQAGQGPKENFGQDNQAYSIFGNIDWHLTDRFTATLGLNYTSDEKAAFGNAVNTDTFSALDLVGFGVVGLRIPATLAANPSVNPLLALRPLQFLPPFLNFPNSVEDGKSSDNDVTYTVRAAYEATDNLNLYASYATGFKATSWNLSRDSRPSSLDFIPGSPASSPAPAPSAIRTAGLAVPNLTAGTRFAGPEESKVIELGAKFSSGDFAANLTLFDQVISGFQSNVFTGTGFALANAGKQSTRGFEVDANWNVTDNLLLTVAGTFQDPKYDSFPNSASGDLSGTAPSGISETSTSVAGTYTFDVGTNEVFLRADWQYDSPTNYFDDVANQRLIGEQREVSTVNAAGGFTTEGGLGVSVFGRNIFDDEYITTAFPSVAQAGSLSGYPNAPATYGVTVRKAF